ncbi:hypothetical protein [Halomonas sp. H5]|uniref:hypothetical protein n=1 Tax=Halomonas sp. H5 TaxID=3423910 RepID=UPI003D3652B7
MGDSPPGNAFSMAMPGKAATGARHRHQKGSSHSGVNPMVGAQILRDIARRASLAGTQGDCVAQSSGIRTPTTPAANQAFTLICDEP